jgi:leucyl/phenylalanyl-tRNA--protein transferase
MADDEGRIRWLAPDPRAVIDLDAFKISRSLKTEVRRESFELSVNRAFSRVIEACADRAEGTWISPEIQEAYRELHRLGFAHSVESWQGGELAGGLYGVAIGGAFFGESMFHLVGNASKIALVRLVERMREHGFELLDVQFLTDHLRRFGAREIPKRYYEARLRHAIRLPCSFVAEGSASTVRDL